MRISTSERRGRRGRREHEKGEADIENGGTGDENFTAESYKENVLEQGYNDDHDNEECYIENCESGERRFVNGGKGCDSAGLEASATARPGGTCAPEDVH